MTPKEKAAMYEKEAEEYEKAGRYKEAAASREKAGEILDDAGEHTKAAKTFGKAAENREKAGDYGKAARNREREAKNWDNYGRKGEAFDKAADDYEKVGLNALARQRRAQAGEAYEAYGDRLAADGKDKGAVTFGYLKAGSSYKKAGLDGEANRNFNKAGDSLGREADRLEKSGKYRDAAVYHNISSKYFERTNNPEKAANSLDKAAKNYDRANNPADADNARTRAQKIRQKAGLDTGKGAEEVKPEPKPKEKVTPEVKPYKDIEKEAFKEGNISVNIHAALGEKYTDLGSDGFFDRTDGRVKDTGKKYMLDEYGRFDVSNDVDSILKEPFGFSPDYTLRSGSGTHPDGTRLYHGESPDKARGINETFSITPVTEQKMKKEIRTKTLHGRFRKKTIEEEVKVPDGKPRPVSHNEIVKGSTSKEQAYKVTYTARDTWQDNDLKNAYRSSDGRRGQILEVQAIVPESVAKDLMRAVKKDPTVARKFAHKAVTEISGIPEQVWKQGYKQPDGSFKNPLRPPYEAWDAKPGGSEMYIFESGEGKFNPKNVYQVKKKGKGGKP